MKKDTTPSEKALEKQKEAVRSLSEKEIKEVVAACTFGDGNYLDAPMYLAELEAAHIDIEAMEKEIADLRKMISKMKQQHEAEIAELEDEIMELKVIEKKKNEYADALDDDSVTFEKILNVAKTIACMAESVETLAYMIRNEAEVKM